MLQHADPQAHTTSWVSPALQASSAWPSTASLSLPHIKNSAKAKLIKLGISAFTNCFYFWEARRICRSKGRSSSWSKTAWTPCSTLLVVSAASCLPRCESWHKATIQQLCKQCIYHLETTLDLESEGERRTWGQWPWAAFPPQDATCAWDPKAPCPAKCHKFVRCKGLCTSSFLFVGQNKRMQFIANEFSQLLLHNSCKNLINIQKKQKQLAASWKPITFGRAAEGSACGKSRWNKKQGAVLALHAFFWASRCQWMPPLINHYAQQNVVEARRLKMLR